VYTHQDGFCAAVGIEAKLRSFIPYQIEFYIATATQHLPLLFLLRKRLFPVAIDQFDVQGGKQLANLLHKSKALLLGEFILLAEAVKENTTDTTRLVTMLEEK